MYTGLIDHCGCIIAIESLQNSCRFWIESRFQDLLHGESISIDGVCLTVVEIDGTRFCCDISPETLRITTLGQYQVNQKINIERSLCLGARMGGHFVMGHVDQTCVVKHCVNHDGFKEITFGTLTEQAQDFLITKGSVAINGVSLTVNEVGNDYFKVMLIPETLARTNLAGLQAQDLVNVEFDWLMKVIAKQIDMRISNQQIHTQRISS